MAENVATILSPLQYNRQTSTLFPKCVMKVEIFGIFTNINDIAVLLRKKYQTLERADAVLSLLRFLDTRFLNRRFLNRRFLDNTNYI